MAVWVRKGEDGSGLLFPVRDNHLLLRSIAAHWQLNPSTILVGDLALTADEDGKSIFTIDDIRAYSSAAGLGDGCTKQSAFLIAGQPASTGVTSTITVPKKNEEKPLAMRLAAAAVSFEEFRKLPVDEQNSLRKIRLELLDERYNTRIYQLHRSESGLHHYTHRIYKDSLEKAIAPFAGELYVVPKDCPDTKVRNSDAVGMVSLVRPEGLCLTALDLVGDFMEEKEKILVKFPLLTGDLLYECTIVKTAALVVHLETVEKQSFKGCFDIQFSSGTGIFMFDGLKSMKLIDGFYLDVYNGAEIMFLPTSQVDPNTALGGPVVNRRGELKGIVVDASSFLKKPGSASNKVCRTRYGKKTKFQFITELEDEKQRAEAMHELHASLGNSHPNLVATVEKWNRVFQLRRVVEYMPSKVKSVTDEWLEQNPLTKFIDKVEAKMKMPKKPCVRSKNPSLTKLPPMSKEHIQRFYAEQEAMNRFHDRLL